MRKIFRHFMLEFTSPYLASLADPVLGKSPSEMDCQWLLSTIRSLCTAAHQTNRYPELVTELVDRGFVPPEYQDCDEKRPVRVGSPFSQVYSELGEIGEGGYGKVYKVQNLIDKQVYALKVITLQEDEVPMAVREVQCLAHLNSPRIVRYFSSWVEEMDVGHDLSLFIQMEFVHGISLSEWIHTRREVNVPFVMSVVHELAHALNEIHSAGIVHRDFRPENIMLREGGGVCVLDFGISSLKQKSEWYTESPPSPPDVPIRIGSLKEVRTLDRMCITAADLKFATVREVGTPIYSSPKQLNGSKSGPKDDIYSFGIVIFEMLSNFKTNMEKTKAIAALRNKRVVPDDFQSAYPDIAKLVLQMTEPHHRLRPSAEDLLKSEVIARYGL